jgi:predicted house-cleaning noncanonical NTP pyrophosphatase (MazG superfamily)
MERLRELVKVINRLKVNQINVIGNYRIRETMSDEFYEKICNDEFKNDDEAAQHFFNTGSDNRNYKLLKKRFEANLLNTVFFIDAKQNNFTLSQRAYYTILKEMAAAKILIARGVGYLSIELLERSLQKAEKFEFIDMAAEITKILKRHYGTRDLNEQLFNHYKQRTEYYRKLIQIEDLAEEYFIESNLFFSKNKSNPKAIQEFAAIRFEELAPYLSSYTTYRLQLYVRLLQIQALSTKSNTQQMLEACNQAIEFFTTINAKSGIQLFLNRKALAHYQLRQYEEGKITIQKALEIHVLKSLTWLQDMYFYLILCLHMREYQQAYDIYKQVAQAPNYRQIPNEVSEFWKIAEAYIYYLIAIGKIEAEEGKQFKLNKFLNEVPEFSKDKRIRNIPILIVQVLFLLQGSSKSISKQNLATERINPIEQYCSRYLRKGNNFRSNCFIKMLLQIPSGYFNKIAIERKSTKYVKLLKESDVEFVTQTYEIELIPYEHLWEMALNSF